MPGGGNVKIHADASEQNESSENVHLPRQFFQLETLIDDRQRQRKRGPEWREPAIGILIRRKQSQQSGGRERMKESGGAGETFLRSGFARKEVQASSDERDRKDAQRDGAPEFLFEIVVVKIGAEQSADTDDVRLPGELLVTDPARGERERHSENNPADRDPGSAERFFENPDHQPGGDPGIGDPGQGKMTVVLRTQ